MWGLSLLFIAGCSMEEVIDQWMSLVSSREDAFKLQIWIDQRPAPSPIYFPVLHWTGGSAKRVNFTVTLNLLQCGGLFADEYSERYIKRQSGQIG